ncbi:MAG TPA: styrene monooxygenase/indole monooxygenase family protein [Solirubrobacteraceae bacterium]|nr:styrene monooxygenase/indole monooxygenase family protein [Solirubrobacteraceae bacterium]
MSLLLQSRGVPVTLYADRTPEEMRHSPRLANTAGHWVPTREREAQLGVNHWDELAPPVPVLNVDVGGGLPLRFSADLGKGPIAVDYRIQMPRLLEDFVERGGSAVFGAVERHALDAMAEQHDLVVISSGRGTMTELFPKIDERSPYSRPQRILQISACRGIDLGAGSISYELVPGVGECLLFPYLTVEGPATILYLSAAVDGPLPEMMDADLAGDADRAELDGVFRRVVTGFFPASSGKIDWDAFATLGPRYDIAGALTPTVRRPFAQLENGRWVLALGDVHTVNDPLLGQGSNSASATAFIVADAIDEDPYGFDELWVTKTAERMWQRAGGAVGFTNTLLAVPPAPQVVQVLAAASGSPEMAEFVGEFFGTPTLAWSVLASPERAQSAIATIAGPEALEAVARALSSVGAS